jgi:hypothetical protein
MAGAAGACAVGVVGAWQGGYANGRKRGKKPVNYCSTVTEDDTATALPAHYVNL